jgi:hypothetical protein
LIGQFEQDVLDQRIGPTSLSASLFGSAQVHRRLRLERRLGSKNSMERINIIRLSNTIRRA